MAGTAHVHKARDDATTRARQRRRQQRALNGYRKDRHTEKDKAPQCVEYKDNLKEMHERALALYKEYLEEEIGVSSEKSVYLHCPAPSLLTWKNHMRWYANSVKGKLRDQPTKSSTLNHAERLFIAFTDATQTPVSFADRCEIYRFIRTQMVKDGEVANVKKQKFLFTVKNFLHLHKSVWTLDDPVFIHGRVKAQMTFLYQIGLFSGSRLGAYVPPPSLALKEGIRYRTRKLMPCKDVELVLMPLKGLGVDHWSIDSRLTQRHVKNNKDPENSVYSNVMADDERLPFAATLLLLTFAFADDALWGFDSPDDLWQQNLPLDPAGRPEPVPLIWKNKALYKPVCRAVNRTGVDPMRAFDKVSFSNIHIALTRNAGYSETPTYHSIRREVGKELTKRYTPEERSQVLNQDPSVYGRDYIAHTSSADVKNAVTGGEERADLLEYFQSFEQFLIHGLPCRLPSEKEKETLADPELSRQREQLKKVECNRFSSSPDIRALKVKLKTTETSLLKKALRRYQEEWVSDYRNSTILSRGKTRRDTSQKSWLSHTLGKIMPERSRLTKTMPGTAQITYEEKLAVLKDLISYVTRDYSVVYLPNKEPIHDMCPVQGCQQKMTDLKNRAKSKHVHHCRRNEFAQKHRREPSTVQYCYFDCFNWFCDGEEWEEHCRQHLESLTSLHCEVIMYCNTMIRPAYYPQCLGNISLKPSERLRKYVRSDDLRNHLEKNYVYDSVCSPLLCGYKFDSDEHRAYHWCDMHGLNSAMWKKMIASQSIKSEKLSIKSIESSQNALETKNPILCVSRDVPTNTGCWKANDDRYIARTESIVTTKSIPIDMDWETTSPLLTEASSISRQPSPELIPIDPRILSEQHIEITESAHEDPQKENVTCHQAGQNTVLDIEVPGEQGHNTCDTSTDSPTAYDLLQIPDTCTKPSKTCLVRYDLPLSEGPMTRAKRRAQSRVTKAPHLRPRRKCRVY